MDPTVSASPDDTQPIVRRPHTKNDVVSGVRTDVPARTGMALDGDDTFSDISQQDLIDADIARRKDEIRTRLGSPETKSLIARLSAPNGITVESFGKAVRELVEAKLISRRALVLLQKNGTDKRYHALCVEPLQTLCFSLSVEDHTSENILHRATEINTLLEASLEAASQEFQELPPIAPASIEASPAAVPAKPVDPWDGIFDLGTENTPAHGSRPIHAPSFVFPQSVALPPIQTAVGDATVEYYFEAAPTAPPQAPTENPATKRTQASPSSSGTGTLSSSPPPATKATDNPAKSSSTFDETRLEELTRHNSERLRNWARMRTMGPELMQTVARGLEEMGLLDSDTCDQAVRNVDWLVSQGSGVNLSDPNAPRRISADQRASMARGALFGALHSYVETLSDKPENGGVALSAFRQAVSRISTTIESSGGGR